MFCRRDHLVCTVWKICAHVSNLRASFAKSRHLQWHLEITWLPAPWLHRQPRWTLTGFKHWVVSMPSTSLLLRNFQKTRKRRETTTMMSPLHWSTWYCYWSTTSCSSTVVVPGSNTHCTTKIPVIVASSYCCTVSLQRCMHIIMLYKVNLEWVYAFYPLQKGHG